MRRYAALTLVLPIVCLVVIGMIALMSTGAYAPESHGSANFLVKRQAVWLVISLVTMVAVVFIDYHFWVKTWWFWFGLATLFLVFCFVPSIGLRINGSSRWVRLGFINFQPSELGKLATIFFLSMWYSRFQDKIKTLYHGVIIPVAVITGLCVLILIEVDIGTTGLIVGILVGLMFIAGVSVKHLTPPIICGATTVCVAVFIMKERLGRFLAFLEPEKYLDTDFYQQHLALLAFGSGGIRGLGLGNSRMKMDYLPFAHTDFIFPIIGEEMGLWMTLLVVFFYLIIFLSGCCIAYYASDRIGQLLGFGLTLMVTLQALINIGVVTGVLPNKGFPLPFVSYGGSNLLVCMFAIGILINIYRSGLPTNRIEVRNVLRTRTTRTLKI